MKANIMIDQERRARLIDFGLLNIISENTNSTTSITTGGTVRWMSPELLQPGLFGSNSSRPTEESDRYALGMVVYEVLTGRAPFAQFMQYIVATKIIDGERPPRPEGVRGVWFTDDLWRMLVLCWKTDARDRPSIEAVRECLEKASSTWEPLPGGVEGDEFEFDLTVLTVRIPVWPASSSRACG